MAAQSLHPFPSDKSKRLLFSLPPLETSSGPFLANASHSPFDVQPMRTVSFPILPRTMRSKHCCLWSGRRRYFSFKSFSGRVGPRCFFRRRAHALFPSFSCICAFLFPTFSIVFSLGFLTILLSGSFFFSFPGRRYFGLLSAVPAVACLVRPSPSAPCDFFVMPFL